jgi:phage shock protein A
MAADASAKSIADLRQFERSLKSYQDSLVQSTNDAVRAMNAVNEGWNDKVQAEFMQKFSEALKGIKKMAELVDERRCSVHKSIEKLEDYLNTK